jgi:hypothetical protein
LEDGKCGQSVTTRQGIREQRVSPVGRALLLSLDNALASAGLDRLTHKAHVVVITGASFRAHRSL